jgi:hypothetical protein
MTILDSLAQVQELKPEDLQSFSYPETVTGGMHVGMPKGMKIIHKPTGVEVVCTHHRSQHKNRDACLRGIAAALGDGPALLAMMEDHSPDAGKMGEDSARLDWLDYHVCAARRVFVSYITSCQTPIHLPADSHIEKALRLAFEAARAGERG